MPSSFDTLQKIVDDVQVLAAEAQLLSAKIVLEIARIRGIRNALERKSSTRTGTARIFL